MTSGSLAALIILTAVLALLALAAFYIIGGDDDFD